MDLVRPAAYRQSLIAAFDSCPKRALFSMLDNRRTPSPMAASGTLFHRFAHGAIKEMLLHGEGRLSVEQGLEMLVHVVAQADVPPEDVVPLNMNEMRWLRVKVTKWCEDADIDIRRIMEVEFRLNADIALPTGVTRTITGQMDLLSSDPPDGVVVLDYKTGFKRPKQPKETDDPEAEEDGRGLTELGWAQSLIYAYLVLHNYPLVQRVIFREWHVLWGEKRQVTIWRWQAERMQDLLAQQVALLDQAIEGGIKSPRWVTSAGPHCALCALPRYCPIRKHVGIPTDADEARRLAQEWVAAAAIRNERTPFIKGWVEHHGPVEIPHSDGRRVVGWNLHGDGSRNFGIFEPQDVPESPFDKVLASAAQERGVLIK